LEAGEPVEVAEVGFAQERIGGWLGKPGNGSGLADDPELGFEAGEALEEPIGADQRIDEKALEPGGGSPLLVIAGGHGFEFAGIFAGDDLGFGVDARFEGIETGNGLALQRARAGRELRIATIRLDLTG
jgi:hypothetical protein